MDCFFTTSTFRTERSTPCAALTSETARKCQKARIYLLASSPLLLRKAAGQLPFAPWVEAPAPHPTVTHPTLRKAQNGEPAPQSQGEQRDASLALLDVARKHSRLLFMTARSSSQWSGLRGESQGPHLGQTFGSPTA